MSGIAGISSSWLQNNLFAAAQTPQAAGQVQDADGDFDNSPAGDTSATTGVTGTTGGNSASALRDQILAAIKDAVAKFDPNGSLGDLKQTIQTAVQDTLKQNGIDPAQLKPTHGKGHHHHAKASTAPMPAQPSTDPFAPTSDTSTTDPTSADQIKNQIIAGILGSTDNASAFGALMPLMGDAPAGVAIDTQA